MDADFGWDSRKAELNIQNHGVSFEEAVTVFDDPLARIFEDEEHSGSEARALLVGYSVSGRLLFVSYGERDEVVRIISARNAEPWERRNHEQGTRR